MVLLAALWVPLGAADRRVIVIDLDGLRHDTFEQTYREGRLPNFQRILEAALWFENAAAVFPTVTLTGHASLYTGVDPARHGIIGNEWFDRAAERLVDYTSPAGAACVYGYTLFGSECRGGLANRHLQAPTLYEAATAAGATSMAVFSQYWKGATYPVPPGPADVLSFFQSESLDYEAFDARMMDRALEALVEKGLPDILTLYFAGTDGIGHVEGTAGQPRHLERGVDFQLGRLLDALEWLDPQWRARTLFIITSDHGRTDAVLNPEDLTLGADLLAALARAGFDGERVRLATNGGMAYVYLRGESWAEAPPEEAVRTVVRELSEDPLLGRAVESVRARTERDSPRAGELIVSLRPGHYFGNRGVGSHHGSAHDPDRWVPLVLAQGGVPAGRSQERVAITQVAGAIAAYVGFPIDAVEPALPVAWPPRKAVEKASIRMRYAIWVR